MAHYEIFREQLATKYPAFGHALWVPNSEGPDSCVEVGDVGYTREGKFHRLYNALLPANHPSHRKLGAPRDHEPLIPNPSDHIKTSTLESGHYCSRGVCVAAAESDVRASKPGDFSQVSFKCKRKQRGAALFLPTQTECQDTIARGDFGQWIIKHFEESLRFARRHGLGIDQMEDIMLVTGCHRTRSWANVAFLESQGEEPVSFEVKVAHTEDADINIDWQISPEQIRGAAVFSWGPSGKVCVENRCSMCD
ncbi:hypothetical protein F5148DRAFT_332843 [Russula earlei]|uniref:Uncharacterized protein n=1 Tax=Russula earlei TaxID=71964 RepID=A0ACC0U257_9AGAM|nr:hypothetical protein F5148DRAFT_332843 [Russula earlei]